MRKRVNNLPSFKKKEIAVTPGMKILPSKIEKLKYICEQYKRSQAKQIEFWIDEEYKRLKRIEKQGYEIL